MNPYLSAVLAAALLLVGGMAPAIADSALQVSTDAAITSTIQYDNSVTPTMTAQMINQIQNGGCIPMGALFSDSSLNVSWTLVGTMAPGKSLHASFAVCNDPPPAGYTRHEEFQLSGYAFAADGKQFNANNNITVSLKTPSGTPINMLFIYNNQQFKKGYVSVYDTTTPDGPLYYSILEPGVYTVDIANPGKINLHVELGIPLYGLALTAVQ